MASDLHAETARLEAELFGAPEAGDVARVTARGPRQPELGAPLEVGLEVAVLGLETEAFAAVAGLDAELLVDGRLDGRVDAVREVVVGVVVPRGDGGK